MSIYEILKIIIPETKTRLLSSYFIEERREQLNTEDEKELFDLLRNISSMAQKVNNVETVFQPMMRWEGRRTFALEDLNEDDYVKLKELELSNIPTLLSARVADILWIQKRNYQAALLAIQAYLDLFEKSFDPEHWTTCITMITRAVCISAQINNRDLKEQCYRVAYTKLVLVDGKDKLFFTTSIVRLLFEQGYQEYDILLAFLDKRIENDDSNVDVIEKAYLLKAEIYRKKTEDENAKMACVKLAEYYMGQAEKMIGTNIHNAVRAEDYYQKAIYLYRNNGEAEKAEKAHRRLVEVQSYIPDSLMSFKMEIDASKLAEYLNTNLDGLSFEECLFKISQLVSFNNREEMRKRILEGKETSVFELLSGKNTINNNGQTIFKLPSLNLSNPEADEKLLDLYVINKMFDHQNTSGELFRTIVYRYIQEHYTFTIENLEFLVKNNPIIPEGRERIFASAIYMVLKGQYYEAVHILAPQMENLFRNIAKDAGALTVTLESDGTSKEKVLSSIFDLPELMDCYDNNILFFFKGIMNEQAGANIRNMVGHGLLSEKQGSTGASVYFTLAVIKLLALTSQECYQMIEKNEKIRTWTPEEGQLIDIKKAT